MDPTEVPTQRNAESPGPVFVSGRQHSGNSVMTKVLSRAQGCLAFIGDNGYIEHRALIDAETDPKARLDRAFRAMRWVENPHLEEPAREHMERWIRENPGADTYAIYLETMDACRRHEGASFWVQKATSYIFYVEEILERIPGSKIIYLVRNPYDIAASRQKRNPGQERMWAIALSWRKGSLAAERLQEQYPDRFRTVRYEDLVTKPKTEVPSIFEFLGYPYDPSVLDVPRVNTSDKPYDWGGTNKEPRGLSGFRIYYYTDVLDPAAIRAVDIVAKRDVVEMWYPDLPHITGKIERAGAIKGGLKVAASFLFEVKNQLTRTRGYPKGMLDRIKFIMARMKRRIAKT